MADIITSTVAIKPRTSDLRVTVDAEWPPFTYSGKPISESWTLEATEATNTINLFKTFVEQHLPDSYSDSGEFVELGTAPATFTKAPVILVSPDWSAIKFYRVVTAYSDTQICLAPLAETLEEALALIDGDGTWVAPGGIWVWDTQAYSIEPGYWLATSSGVQVLSGGELVAVDASEE